MEKTDPRKPGPEVQQQLRKQATGPGKAGRSCSETGNFVNDVDEKEMAEEQEGQTVTESIQLTLFATLTKYMPDGAEKYPIDPGTTVRELIAQLNIPSDHAKLVFIDGKKAELENTLQGVERVGIFPPIAGG